MSGRSVIGVLLAFGLLLVLSSSSVAEDPRGTLEGVAGDGFLDFYIDLMPPGETEDPGNPGSFIDPDGNNINGFVLQSASGIFDGPEPALLQGWFTTDTDVMISDGMGFTLDHTWYLGDILRPDVLCPPIGTGWSMEQLLEDLTVTYTLDGAPGTYYGDVIRSDCGGTQCDPLLMDAIPDPTFQVSWWGPETLTYQVTTTGGEGAVTFAGNPAIPGPAGATIEADGMFSWDKPTLDRGEIGSVYEVGVIASDECPVGVQTAGGVITIEIIPEPTTVAMLLSGVLLGLGLAWRRRS